jgi:hypothetical protein
MTVARKVNPCTACGQPGHRSDSKKCPKRGQARAACTYCKRKDGTHSAGCKRKAATGAGTASKPKPAARVAVRREALVGARPKSIEARARLALDEAKRRVQELRAELGTQEQQVLVLTELVDG